MPCKSVMRLLGAAAMLAFMANGVFGEQPMSLENLLQRTSAAMHWDAQRHIGRLTRNGTVLVFRPGDRWMVLNGQTLVVTGTVLEEDGRLIFSPDAAQTVFQIFGVDSEAAGGYELSTILIDPGHGGRDPGAEHRWPVDGMDFPLREKDLVLEISLRLAESLRQSYPDKQVMLTRSTDVYPSLEDRVSMANDVHLSPREGMIYISIHANASLNRKAEGYEVWYLPPDYRRTVVDSNSPEGNNPSIAPIVNTLWEETFTHESVRLADMILDGFQEALGEDVPNRGRREESWFVVRNARMASVLVEVGFITHSSEAARLRRSGYLSRIVSGIYNGVSEFITYFESQESFP